MRTTILIPTYNEAGNIVPLITQIVAVLPEATVVVVDDNSPDGTAGLVQKLTPHHPQVRVIVRTADRGFARSYVEGFRHVLAVPEADYVVMMDADFSHDPKELPHLLAALDQGADVALGSRHVRGASFPGIPRWRKILSWAAQRYVRTILSLPIHDCTSGYIAMRVTVLSRLNLAAFQAEGYGFLFELKYQLSRQQVNCTEYPVAWPDRRAGKSKLSWAIVFDSLALPWKIKWRQRAERSAAVQ